MSRSESKDSAYGEAYRQWKSWNEADFGVLERLKYSYFDAEVKRADAQLPAAAKVLEVGFGNGAFLAYVRKKGWDVVGTEVNQGLIDLARGQNYNVVRADDLSGFSDESFDLIAAFDVLEHIPGSELPEFFRSIRSKLKPDGVFIARFPNGDSPLGLPNQNGDLTHVTAIGSEIGRYLCDQAGLRLISLGAEAMPIMVGSLKHSLHRLVSYPIKVVVNFIVNKLILPGAKIEFCSSNLTLIARKPTE